MKRIRKYEIYSISLTFFVFLFVLNSIYAQEPTLISNKDTVVIEKNITECNLGLDFSHKLGYSEYIVMENVMTVEIISREEELLELLGIPWNGWGYELEEFAQINLELEANGVPTYKSFEEYLEGRLKYKQRIAA